MNETYELFLRSRDGREWFVALTCEPKDVAPLAHQTLADQDAVDAEVRQFGQSLFVISRDGSP